MTGPPPAEMDPGRELVPGVTADHLEIAVSVFSRVAAGARVLVAMGELPDSAVLDAFQRTRAAIDGLNGVSAVAAEPKPAPAARPSSQPGRRRDPAPTSLAPKSTSPEPAPPSPPTPEAPPAIIREPQALAKLLESAGNLSRTSHIVVGGYRLDLGTDTTPTIRRAYGALGALKGQGVLKNLLLSHLGSGDERQNADLFQRLGKTRRPSTPLSVAKLFLQEEDVGDETVLRLAPPVDALDYPTVSRTDSLMDGVYLASPGSPEAEVIDAYAATEVVIHDQTFPIRKLHKPERLLVMRLAAHPDTIYTTAEVEALAPTWMDKPHTLVGGFYDRAGQTNHELFGAAHRVRIPDGPTIHFLTTPDRAQACLDDYLTSNGRLTTLIELRVPTGTVPMSLREFRALKTGDGPSAVASSASDSPPLNSGDAEPAEVAPSFAQADAADTTETDPAPEDEPEPTPADEYQPHDLSEWPGYSASEITFWDPEGGRTHDISKLPTEVRCYVFELAQRTGSVYPGDEHAQFIPTMPEDADAFIADFYANLQNPERAEHALAPYFYQIQLDADDPTSTVYFATSPELAQAYLDWYLRDVGRQPGSVSVDVPAGTTSIALETLDAWQADTTGVAEPANDSTLEDNPAAEPVSWDEIASFRPLPRPELTDWGLDIVVKDDRRYVRYQAEVNRKLPAVAVEILEIALDLGAVYLDDLHEVLRARGFEKTLLHLQGVLPIMKGAFRGEIAKRIQINPQRKIIQACRERTQPVPPLKHYDPVVLQRTANLVKALALELITPEQAEALEAQLKEVA